MAIWQGCAVPDELLYDLEHDVWVRLEGDEAVLGMTDVAQTRCGRLVQVSWKQPGARLKRGRPACVIESAKWVGPFVSPLGGELTATNEEAFAADVAIANRDPYEAGWLVRMRPGDLEAERGYLVDGEAAFEHYRQLIDEHDMRCFRCAD